MQRLDPLTEVAEEVALLDQAGELGRQRVGVARLEQEPPVAVRERLLVLRQPGCDRYGASSHRAERQLRGGGDARGGHDDDVGPREVLALGAVGRAGEAHAVAYRTSGRHRRLGPRLPRPHRGLPREVRREAPQRPQEEAHGCPFLLRHVEDLHQLALLLGVRSRDELGAGLDHAVVAREVAGEQIARRREARGAPVEAAEHELHDLACDLRRDDALARRVERADVQRTRVAQCGRRRARRERLVHVHEVERGSLEERVRAGDAAGAVVPGRSCRGGRAGAVVPGSVRPSAEHGLRAVSRPLDPVARLADQLARVRRRDDDHAVAPRAEVVRELLDEPVDLVVLLPGVRRDLGDREALVRHGRESTLAPLA